MRKCETQERGVACNRPASWYLNSPSISCIKPHACCEYHRLQWRGRFPFEDICFTLLTGDPPATDSERLVDCYKTIDRLNAKVKHLTAELDAACTNASELREHAYRCEQERDAANERTKPKKPGDGLYSRDCE